MCNFRTKSSRSIDEETYQKSKENHERFIPTYTRTHKDTYVLCLCISNISTGQQQEVVIVFSYYKKYL